MTVAAGQPVLDSIGRRILLSLQLLDRVQHWDGEIVSYRDDGHGNHVYCRTPLPSAYVHDALSCFDPMSPGWIDGVLDVIPARVRPAFVRTAIRIRRRIREFLSWQQEPAGWWRVLGRGSGMDPDVNTTALAALALRESYGPHSASRWERQIRVLLSFRSPSGPFDTFRKPGGDAYGWLEAGRTVAGFDPVVNTAVLDSLCALTGRDDAVVRQLAEYLLTEVLTGDTGQRGTELYPNPLVLLHGVARAWARHDLPHRDRMTAAVLPALLRAQSESGDFGGPLSTALGASALLDLGDTGPHRSGVRLAVLRSLRPRAGRPYADLLVRGIESPAVTTALSMAWLARDAHLTGGLDG